MFRSASPRGITEATTLGREDVRSRLRHHVDVAVDEFGEFDKKYRNSQCAKTVHDAVYRCGGGDEEDGEEAIEAPQRDESEESESLMSDTPSPEGKDGLPPSLYACQQDRQSA